MNKHLLFDNDFLSNLKNKIKLNNISWQSLGVKIVLLAILPTLIFATINVITVNKNNSAYQQALSERTNLDKQNDEILKSATLISDIARELSDSINQMSQYHQSMLLSQLLSSDASLSEKVLQSRVLVKTKILEFGRTIKSLQLTLQSSGFLPPLSPKQPKSNQALANANEIEPQDPKALLLKNNLRRIKRLERNARVLLKKFSGFTSANDATLELAKNSNYEDAANNFVFEGRSRMVAITKTMNKMVKTLNQLLEDIKVLKRIKIEDSTNAITKKSNNLLSNIYLMNLIFGVSLCLLAIYYSRKKITQPLQEITIAMNAAAKGDLSITLPDMKNNDEISVMTRALKIFISMFSDNKRISDEASRIRIALDNAASKVMLLDLNDNIIFLNQAMSQSITKYRVDFSQAIDNFSSNNMLEVCLTKQLKTKINQNLPNLKCVAQEQIPIGNRTFQLTMSPVFNELSEHLGTVIEWNDRTEELLFKSAEDDRLEKEKQRMADEKIISEENYRVKQALDNVSTSVMIADADHNVIYLNSAGKELFTQAELDICSKIHDFSAKRLVGSKIELLQVNSNLQSQLLDELTTNYSEQVLIGRRTLAFTVNPIDSDGVRIGTVVEWLDRTEEVAVENEIDDLVGFASKGDLSRRIDTTEKTGFYQKLGVGLNSLISVVDDAVIETTAMLNAMAEGDLTSRITGDYQGAFGEIKLSANTTVEKLASVMDEINLIVKAANKGNLNQRVTTTGKSGFFATLGQELNELVSVVDGALAEIASMLNAMVKGNMTIKINTEFEGSFEEIKTSANDTVDKLVEIIDELRVAAVSVSDGSKDVAEGNTYLSQRTESQAVALDETSSNIQSLTQLVKQCAINADNANSSAVKASETATGGVVIVEKAVDAMATISDSSRRIGDIIGVIEEISFQTNLLALNAAVEAARAGEQGRGFAVVASEVRNLAGRSTEAAKEIKDLINTSESNVRIGSDLVNQSGKALHKIVAAVKDVSEIISEVAKDTKEQSTSIEEINTAVSQMDAMTQQNSALVEEVMAASGSMADQAMRVSDSLDFFNTSRKNSD